MGKPAKMGSDYAQEFLERVSHTLNRDFVYSYSLAEFGRLLCLRDNLYSSWTGSESPFSNL